MNLQYRQLLRTWPPFGQLFEEHRPKLWRRQGWRITPPDQGRCLRTGHQASISCRVRRTTCRIARGPF